MKKKFICLIAGIVIIGIAAGGYYFANRQDTPINKDNKNNVINKTIENKKKENIIDYQYELDKKYPVEEGFLTTIKGGSTEEEVIDNNLLEIKSDVSIMDRLEAKRIAENFGQSLMTYDVNDMQKLEDIAMKYVSNEIQSDVKKEFKDHSYTKDMKRIIKAVYSEEVSDEILPSDENDDGEKCIYFRVSTRAEGINNENKSTGSIVRRYVIKLFKVKNKIEIVDFKLDASIPLQKERQALKEGE